MKKRKIPANPANYKTQQGLINALVRASEIPMDMKLAKLAWWFHKANYALIHNWGWEEEAAAKFVAAYHPHTSVYRATS